MLSKSLALFVVASAVVATASAPAAWAQQPAKSWTQWRGPGREGKSPYKGLNKNWEKSPPKLLWTAEGLGTGYASVSIDGGKIYTTGNLEDGQYLICIADGQTKPLWKTKLTEGKPQHDYEGARSTPTIDGNRLYVVSSDGRISCVDSEAGEVLWSRSFKDFGGRMMSGWGFSESPLIDGDRVLCTPGGDDAIVVALDKKNGEEIWRCGGPEANGTDARGKNLKKGAGYASIVVSEGAGVRQYVTLVGQGLIGIRAEDGALLWSYEKVANGVANIPTPIPFDDYVFASSGYGTGAALVKLSPADGGVKAEEVYFLKSDDFQNHHGGMVKVGDYIYSGHQHGQGLPICIEALTGEVKWVDRGPGKGSAAVLYVDGCLIFRYQNGLVALIEATPEEYRLLGEFTPAYQERESWAHPVVVDGKLYLREQNKLMCYDVSAST